MHRFISYFINNICSDNSIVRFVFRSAIINETSLGNNLRYILYKCGYNRNIFDNDVVDAKSLCNKIIDMWNGSHKNEDIQIGCHILELVQRRDSLEPWILTKTDIQSVTVMDFNCKYQVIQSFKYLKHTIIFFIFFRSF